MVPALIGLAAFVAAAVFFSLKAHNRMISEGKIISRRTDFMESAEEFVLNAADPAVVAAAVRGLDYADMRTKLQEDGENLSFRFSGNGWTAQLKRESGGTEQAAAAYRFEFTSWKTSGGMPQDALNMNKLITAVEKLFLTLDPGTQVRTVPLEFKTRHSIL